jgi:hypothetical protein
MEKAEFNLFGDDLFGDPIQQNTGSVLMEKFTIPPFSVFDTRQGYWQERKRAWLSLGIQSELGRGGGLLMDSKEVTTENLHYYRRATALARHVTTKIDSAAMDNDKQSGTSIFDPVLCEIIYRWFSAPSAQIIDPFAGGSVRGIVAACLDRRYWGCDLSEKQIAANKEQAVKICPDNPPEWVCADAMDALEDAPPADLVFSCPPYGDLEVYSDDPRNLSNMEWHTFVAAYKRIILRACKKLKPDRFACFVVGDFRDKRGYYRDFVSETIRGFKECGLELYNEAILLTCIGSLPIRVSAQFKAGRKLGKTHQNVLVFCKGDWRKAAAVCNEVGGDGETGRGELT